MKICRVYCAAFFAFVAIFVLTACSNSYTKAKTVTSVSSYPRAIERAVKDHRYFMMWSGVNLYTVTSVDLDNAKQQMTVTLDKVDSSRLANAASAANKPFKPQKGDSSQTAQIHLYMRDSASYTLDEPHTIPLNTISRVQLLN